MADLKITNKLDLNKLSDIKDKVFSLLIGYPRGEVSINGFDSASLAKTLVENNLGENKTGWNFLEEGLLSNKEAIKDLVGKYIDKKIGYNVIGETAVKSIKDFVKSGRLIASNPNERKYLRMKIAKHAESRPLIITEKFINACTFIAVNKV